MWKERVDGYSASLILSEGRYEKRESFKEKPKIKIEKNHKSRLVRIDLNVVKKFHSDLKFDNKLVED